MDNSKVNELDLAGLRLLLPALGLALLGLLGLGRLLALPLRVGNSEKVFTGEAPGSSGA